MALDMNTHGYDWKQRLRQTHLFCALVTPNWHQDTLAQRQYQYAQQRGTPIVLLVKAGTPLPPRADDYTWRVWETTEELAALVAALEDGTLVVEETA